jgi:superfamily II DNA/RNA helicase
MVVPVLFLFLLQKKNPTLHIHVILFSFSVQHVEVITPSEKQRRLEQILRSQDSGSKILIFCTTKRMCDQLARTLTRQFGASAIHGDKSQSEREKVLNHFRSGRSPILVATDVAARGLDIKDIRLDYPFSVMHMHVCMPFDFYVMV